MVDRIPRTLTPEQLEALGVLRRQAEAQLLPRLNLIELQEALAARDRAEEEQHRLIAELRDALDNVQKLSALLPYCSACHFNMTIPADPLKIPMVTDGVTQMLQDRRWSEDRVMAVELALQEALANAIRHGCAGDMSRHVQCVVTCDDVGDVVIVVRDPGSGFETSDDREPARTGERAQTGRARHLPDQPADGRGRFPRRRARAADAETPRTRLRRSESKRVAVASRIGPRMTGAGPRIDHHRRRTPRDRDRRNASHIVAAGLQLRDDIGSDIRLDIQPVQIDAVRPERPEEMIGLQPRQLERRVQVGIPLVAELERRSGAPAGSSAPGCHRQACRSPETARRRAARGSGVSV